jgi:Fe-S-cluster containining protein
MDKHLDLDLEKIYKYGETREDENIEFRIFLKGQDSKEIDRIVHKLNAQISSQIDCNACGNCCKKFGPAVTDDEIAILAEKRQMTLEQFEKDHIEMEDGDKYLIPAPCIFLCGTKCTIYDDRPEVCRSYPHLYKEDFTSRLWGVIENYSICPIVYNVFEALKKELNFKYHVKKRYW